MIAFLKNLYPKEKKQQEINILINFKKYDYIA